MELVCLVIVIARACADTTVQLAKGKYSFVEPKMAWVEDIAHCEGEGGMLVEIDSEEENTALVEEMKRRGFKDRNFWMGLTDRESHGEWTLEKSGSKPSYLDWAEDEPNTKGYDCAQIWN